MTSEYTRVMAGGKSLPLSPREQMNSARERDEVRGPRRATESILSGDACAFTLRSLTVVRG